MKHIIKTARNTLIALGVTGCLAFGATQVMAGTSPKETSYNTCSNPIPYCKNKCGGFGAVYQAGICYCCG